MRRTREAEPPMLSYTKLRSCTVFRDGRIVDSGEGNGGIGLEESERERRSGK